VYSLVLAVRPSLLLSGGLGGMFPHAFAVDLLLLSTFLRYYKGFDHGVGHPLLLLCDTKVPRGQKRDYFKCLGIFLCKTFLSLF